MSKRTITRPCSTTTSTVRPSPPPWPTGCASSRLGLSIAALSQGVPFVHAGSDMLRSKSLDRNSYNSGDWFNKLDFTYQSNNFGVGLPLAGDNQANWDIMKPLLANAALKPAPGRHPAERGDLPRMAGDPQELAALPAAHRGADRVGRPLPQHRAGPAPGLDRGAAGRRRASGTSTRTTTDIVVLFNANDEAQTLTRRTSPATPTRCIRCRRPAPIRWSRRPPSTRRPALHRAGRTTAVFVEKQLWRYRILLFPIFKNAPLGPATPSGEDKALVRRARAVQRRGQPLLLCHARPLRQRQPRQRLRRRSGRHDVHRHAAPRLPAHEHRLLPRRRPGRPDREAGLPGRNGDQRPLDHAACGQQAGAGRWHRRGLDRGLPRLLGHGFPERGPAPGHPRGLRRPSSPRRTSAASKFTWTSSSTTPPTSSSTRAASTPIATRTTTPTGTPAARSSTTATTRARTPSRR